MNSMFSTSSFLLLLVVATNALWDADFFPRDPRHLFFSGRGRRIPTLEAGKEASFSLSRQQWRQYVLKGGAATQECFCIADCATGDLDLFLHASRDYELNLGFDWDCDDTNSESGRAESCRIQPGGSFNCYAVVYGSTAARDCGITCNFLTPP